MGIELIFKDSITGIGRNTVAIDGIKINLTIVDITNIFWDWFTAIPCK